MNFHPHFILLAIDFCVLFYILILQFYRSSETISFNRYYHKLYVIDTVIIMQEMKMQVEDF